jgi:hypothetical protein
MPELPPRQPIAAEPLSVILVAGDTSADLPAIVAGWSAHLAKARPEHEIIVVVRDRSRTEMLEHRHVHIVKESQPGFGAALRTARRQATHPLVLYLPARADCRPEHLQAFLDRIDRVDVVSGTRTGLAVPLPLRGLGLLYRLLIRVAFGIPLEPLPGWLGWRGQAYQRFIRIVFGLRLHDAACPIKLWRRQALDRLPIQSDSSFVHTELLAKANFLTLPVDEAPIPVPPGNGAWWSDFCKVFRHADFGPAPR